MKIAITGHRPNKLGNDYSLTGPLMQKIKTRIDEIVTGYRCLVIHEEVTLISGMALGIDTMFARMAIENKIPLIAAIPCTNQDQFWGEKEKIEYYRLTRHHSTTTVRVSKLPFTNWCMQKRNEWMVDNCDVLIAVWDGSQGGTSNCVRYAKKVGREVIFITPGEL